MTGPATPINCAGCGQPLRLEDVVVASREVPPEWASPGDRTTTIEHQACEPGGRRADHNWDLESPQTLLHLLIKLAEGGNGGTEPSRA